MVRGGTSRVPGWEGLPEGERVERAERLRGGWTHVSRWARVRNGPWVLRDRAESRPRPPAPARGFGTPGCLRPLKSRGADVVGDGEADRVGRPPARCGEPGRGCSVSVGVGDDVGGVDVERGHLSDGSPTAESGHLCHLKLTEDWAATGRVIPKSRAENRSSARDSVDFTFPWPSFEGNTSDEPSVTRGSHT